MSKIRRWQVRNRAVQLADDGHLPSTCRDRWARERERERISVWIGGNCWSEAKQAYIAWPGCNTLDASLALTVRFDFGDRVRIEKTIGAIDRELGAGPLHLRYSGAQAEEGCFLARSFWVAETKALLGHKQEGQEMFGALMSVLGRGSIYPGMIDPASRERLGNLPQGLTHLAIVRAGPTIGR